MNVVLIANTAYPADLCGKAAAVCTDSNNHERALKHAVGSGHLSVLEHAVFTFQVEGISRACLAQLTRHRLASFDVQSQRYVKLDDWDVVMPKSIVGSESAKEKKLHQLALESIQNSMNTYKKLIEAGIPAEDARYVTPQAITTKLIMTMNARELLHFFSLRTCNRAQWEIRELADRMLKICKRVDPVLFENAGPGCVKGGCPELKPCGAPRSAGDWEWDLE